MSDASYSTLGTFSSGRDGFGSNNDLGVIKYYTNGTTIYIGITGELDGNNNIVLFLNFSGYTGRGAGAELDPSGNYEGWVGVFNNAGLDAAKMDMGVDFGLAFNEGNGTSNIYLDAIRYGSSDVLDNANVGNVASQSGTSGALNLGTVFGGTGNITLAYHNGFASDANKGIEFSVPIAAFSGVTNTQTLELFAIITNSTGFMSNECIPGDPGSSNLGNDADLSSIGGQNFYTTATNLPVELTKFTASSQSNSIQLDWQTAMEQNNSHFEIEKSMDGETFKKIGRVNGFGTTTEIQNYAFIDENPLNGQNYYRLKQVDYNGDFEYSDLVVAEFSRGRNTAFYPNPTRDELFIESDIAEAVSIQIYNLQGQLLKQFNDVLLNDKHQINISDLSNGVYQLQLISTNSFEILQQHRLIKQ
jgi:hypothetical protein